MCLIFVPLTIVDIAIGVAFLTHTVHHAIFELTNVLTLVGPSHLSHTAWLILLELPFVNLARIREVVLACTVEHTINKFARIGTSLTRECSLACLLAINEIAFVLDLVVVPILSALTVLLILFPVAFVEATLCIAESTDSVRHAITPLSLVNVAIGVCHTAKTFELAVKGLTLVDCTVRILDGTNTTPFFAASSIIIRGLRLQPLSKILSTFADVFPAVVPDETTVLRLRYNLLQFVIRYHNVF
jgi:hypothetical protein